MTGKADFTQEEWDLILEGPPSAGIIVATSQRGGTFRESIAMGKAYVELLDSDPRILLVQLQSYVSSDDPEVRVSSA